MNLAASEAPHGDPRLLHAARSKTDQLAQVKVVHPGQHPPSPCWPSGRRRQLRTGTLNHYLSLGIFPQYNYTGYNAAMYQVGLHTRPNGSCPYHEYVNMVFRSGKKTEAAKIRAIVERLMKDGSESLTKQGLSEKMNNVWQLRVGAHRIFYFWHTDARRYVILNAFRKQSRKTPPAELQRAEVLRAEHLK